MNPRGEDHILRVRSLVSGYVGSYVPFTDFVSLSNVQISTCVTLLSFSYVIHRMVIKVSAYLMEL